MIWFIRLIRPVNLLIIALTMYSMRFFYFDLAKLQIRDAYTPWIEQLDFFLLVFSTVLIAAGGNIINDYFDVKADRINRPERLIISKHIKQRWAIISHWMLNGVAFSIAIYLSIRYATFWYVFIHLITINALWFYSMYFKRRLLIGNVLIAAMTAMVPLLCGIHFHQVATLEPDVFERAYGVAQDIFSQWIWFMATDGRIIFAMMTFAFILNLAREIVKDAQDVAGDQVIRAQTLPMRYGIPKAARMAALMLTVFPVVSLILYGWKVSFRLHDFFFFLPLVFSLAISLLIAVLLWLRADIIFFRLYDQAIKLAMFCGVILPYYWMLFLS